MRATRPATLGRLSDWVHDVVLVADDGVSAFDQWRRLAGMVFGPLVALAILLAPFSGLTTAEHRLAAVAALVIVFWCTEAAPLPVGSLMAVALIAVTGVAPAAEVLGDALRVDGEAPLLAFSVAASFLIGEVASNTASVNIVLPVVLSVADGLPASGLTVGIGATLAASIGLMLPVSTPPSAIISGARQVSVVEMVRSGVLLDTIGAIVIWLATLWFVPLMLDIAG
jgi:di/tricarboxylate transporter